MQTDSTSHLKAQEYHSQDTLWAIEIAFTYDSENKLHRIRNFSNTDLQRFRNNVFIAGFMYALDPGHWVLISPYNIIRIDVYKQKGRLPDF